MRKIFLISENIFSSFQKIPLVCASNDCKFTYHKTIFDFQVLANQELLADYGVGEGDTLLYINGRSIDLEALDAFQILDTLKAEEKIANGFYRMGIEACFGVVMVKIICMYHLHAAFLDYLSSQT